MLSEWSDTIKAIARFRQLMFLDEGARDKWEQKIGEAQSTLHRIETAVAQLSTTDAHMIERFYRDREHWETIAESMHLSRSRFYEVLDRARRKVEWWVNNDDDRDQAPRPNTYRQGSS